MVGNPCPLYSPLGKGTAPEQNRRVNKMLIRYVPYYYDWVIIIPMRRIVTILAGSSTSEIGDRLTSHTGNALVSGLR